MANDPPLNWHVHHFAQANPFGPTGQGDVPALLRRVADTIEGIDDKAVVQDLVLHTDVNEHGDWYQVTVYYAIPED